MKEDKKNGNVNKNNQILIWIEQIDNRRIPKTKARKANHKLYERKQNNIQKININIITKPTFRTFFFSL